MSWGCGVSRVGLPLLLQLLNSSAEQHRREAGPWWVCYPVEEGAALPGKSSTIPPSGQVRWGHWVNREPASLLPQSIYKKNDSDNSGTMSTPEMRVAFKDAGQFLLLQLFSLWLGFLFRESQTMRLLNVEASRQSHRCTELTIRLRFVHSDFPEAVKLHLLHWKQQNDSLQVIVLI